MPATDYSIATFFVLLDKSNAFYDEVHEVSMLAKDQRKCWWKDSDDSFVVRHRKKDFPDGTPLSRKTSMQGLGIQLSDHKPLQTTAFVEVWMPQHNGSVWKPKCMYATLSATAKNLFLDPCGAITP